MWELTAASGLLANLPAMLFASTIGRWADRHPSRLRTLQLTILVQRASICLACLGWSFLVHDSLDIFPAGIDSMPHINDEPGKIDNGKRATIMAGVILLGMVEKLSAISNKLVMERDWVCNVVILSYGC